MIVTRRDACSPELGACVTVRDALHRRLRVRLVSAQGATVEDALTIPRIGRGMVAQRTRLTLMLAGEGRVGTGDEAQWLAQGDLAIDDREGAFCVRLHDGALLLGIDWEPGWIGRASPCSALAKLDAPTLAGTVRAALRLAAAHDRMEAARAAATLVTCLGDAGLPFETCEAADLLDPVPGHFERLSAALDGALSALHAAPMAVDFEAALGTTNRGFTRLVADFLAFYGLRGPSWRELRKRWRIIFGAALMSHPRARTEDVARALGYGSPIAFCRAFADAGLPSPGNVRGRVAALL